MVINNSSLQKSKNKIGNKLWKPNLLASVILARIWEKRRDSQTSFSQGQIK